MKATKVETLPIQPPATYTISELTDEDVRTIRAGLIFLERAALNSTYGKDIARRAANFMGVLATAASVSAYQSDELRAVLNECLVKLEYKK
jgi:hypothetical protein